MWSELPRHLGVLGAQVYDRGPGGGDDYPLPGGTVLALLAPGSAGGAARRLTRVDVERGVDGREHRVDNQPEDTPSVAQALASWEDDWRRSRSDPAAMVGVHTAAVVRGASRYLEVHARWAANHHEAFREFVDDLRELHLRLEIATHRRRLPVKANADCFACGGDLVREVDETSGLEQQHVTCNRCGAQYDPARYQLALKAAAWDAARIVVDGEMWATPASLAYDLRRSERTVRSWHQRGLVRSYVRGRILFLHVAEVEARHAPWWLPGRVGPVSPQQWAAQEQARAEVADDTARHADAASPVGRSA